MPVHPIVEALSPARQANLLWRVAGSSSWKLCLTERPCRPRPRRASSRLVERSYEEAVLGSDGLFHLVRGNSEWFLCASTRTGRAVKGRHPHEAYEWAVTQTQLNADTRLRRSDWETVRWSVDALPRSGFVDVFSVLSEYRCPGGDWPPSLRYTGRRTGLVMARRRVIDELGPDCSLCGDRWAQVLDHDHFTGMIRGYLCIDCNHRVDYCMHPSGCGYAEYLNGPPAAGLLLHHPEHRQRLKQQRYERRRDAYQAVRVAVGLG